MEGRRRMILALVLRVSNPIQAALAQDPFDGISSSAGGARRERATTARRGWMRSSA